MTVAVVIPALNEDGNIAAVISSLRTQAIGFVIVVDNGSTDRTAEVAAQAGAIVVSEPQRGYGYACAAGSAEALARDASVVVYIDGDQSSLPVRSIDCWRRTQRDRPSWCWGRARSARSKPDRWVAISGSVTG